MEDGKGPFLGGRGGDKRSYVGQASRNSLIRMEHFSSDWKNGKGSNLSGRKGTPSRGVARAKGDRKETSVAGGQGAQQRVFWDMAKK